MQFETFVKEIIPRTYNVKSFRFPRPEQLHFKPGQFFFITLKAGEKELKKHFSFSSSPTEKTHIEFTKKLSDSDFSNALRALKPGDWARIDAPYGKFTFEGEYEKICLLAGGIGITPFMNICKYCTDLKLKTKVILLYGNRTEDDIVFRKELQTLQRENENLRVVFILSEAPREWKGATGLINKELLKKQVPDYKDTVFYTCGPPVMVDVMERLVEEQLGLPKTQLKREYFTGYT